MRLGIAAIAMFAACTSGEPAQTLSIDGPAEVRVETLGPVDGPRFVAEDGSVPEGLVVEVAPSHVARLDGTRVVAVGRGRATVIGRLDDQAVTWSLVVEPAVTLAFHQPPLVIEVGESRPLDVRASIGGEPAIPVDLVWTVEPDGVVELQPGRVIGLAPGIAWVSASHGASEAMLELQVVAPGTDTP